MEEQIDKVVAKYKAVRSDCRPKTRDACLDRSTGYFDRRKHSAYKKKQSELRNLHRKWVSLELEAAEASIVLPKSKKKRRKKDGIYYDKAEEGWVQKNPLTTEWYKWYVLNPENLVAGQDSAKHFRRNFRLPYEEFEALLEDVFTDKLFEVWTAPKRKVCGVVASPVELLVLATLRYLGRGLTFDDLGGMTHISPETIRRFFHVFIEFGSTVLYHKHVVIPRTAAEFATHQSEFKTGGLTGAGFSTDATNVVMWRCPFALRQANIGFKQSHPARTYNIICNHRREILCSTNGHPSRWNDKTLSIYDPFLVGVRSCKILTDVKFELLYRDRVDGIIKTQSYVGPWGLCDNGYIKESFMQAPSKTFDIKERRFSEWIESFRKDSENVFAVLKGRWRVLKTGIRLHGPEAADRIWLTCCALHNKLLHADGLAEEWNESYAGKFGENDREDMALVSFAMQRLMKSTDALTFEEFGSLEHERRAERERLQANHLIPVATMEESAMAVIQSERRKSFKEPEITEDGSIIVNSMSYHDFRSRLIENFMILRARKEVKWPKRLCKEA